jgi:hypothetical protein
LNQKSKGNSYKAKNSLRHKTLGTGFDPYTNQSEGHDIYDVFVLQGFSLHSESIIRTNSITYF